MNLLTVLSVFYIVVGAFSQEYFKSVLVANDDTFNSIIRNKQAKYTFINFYSTSCTYCNALGPQYSILAELFQGNPTVQIAQIEARDNVKTRMQEKIIGFPTMRLYSFDGEHVGSYTKERNAEDMANWIEEHTGAKAKYPEKVVVELKGNDEVEKVVYGSGDRMIAFVAPWLEDWERRISQFEKVSWDFKDSLDFYKVDAFDELNSGIVRDLRITKYPTLFYIRDDGSLKILEEKDLNERKIFRFIEEEEIGTKFDNVNKFIQEKESTDYEDDKEQPKGYGMHRNYGKNEEVDDEEMYKKLREL